MLKKSYLSAGLQDLDYGATLAYAWTANPAAVGAAAAGISAVRGVTIWWESHNP